MDSDDYIKRIEDDVKEIRADMKTVLAFMEKSKIIMAVASGGISFLVSIIMIIISKAI